MLPVNLLRFSHTHHSFFFPLYLLILFLFLPNFLSSQWIQLNTDLESSLYSVHFIDRDNGWIAGFDNLINYSVDGGESWSNTATHGVSLTRWYDIYALDQNEVYACGCRYNYNKYQNNYAYTLNGGNLWYMQSSWGSQGGAWRKVYFLDENYGWKAGYRYGKGRLEKTTMGVSGFADELTFDYQLYSVHFVDQNTGWISGEDGFIAKSSDGGETWADLMSGVTQNLYTLFFFNATTGWAAGYKDDVAIIIKTVDGGETWYQVSHPSVLTLFSMHFIKENIGWACGSIVEDMEERGVILYSNDSGETWTVQYICDEISQLYSVFFIDEHVGWTTGSDGLLLKTVNAGGTSFEGFCDNNSGSLKVSNNPNPVSSYTTFEYYLEKSSNVDITIFNCRGEEVQRIQKFRLQGHQKVVWKPENVSAGIYFFSISNGLKMASGKIIVVN